MPPDEYKHDPVAEIRENAVFRGEVRQFMKDIDSHLRAVSANGKETAKALEEHARDNGAHGASVKREVVNTVGGSIGFLAAAFEIWHHIFPKGAK